MANVAYVRVSTIEQNEERQIQNLKPKGIDKWFIEKKSAKDANREKLREMMNYVREGDCVYVDEFSRLARNTTDLLNIAEELQEKHVEVISIKECFDTSSATGKLMLTMISAIAEFERSMMLERQREGVALAKAKGVYEKQMKKIPKAKFRVYYGQYMNRDITKFVLAKRLNVSRPTLDLLIDDWNGKQERFTDEQWPPISEADVEDLEDSKLFDEKIFVSVDDGTAYLEKGKELFKH